MPGGRSPSSPSGWRRGHGSAAECSASRALFGELEADEADLVDADGVTLGEAFTALGLGDSLPSEAILDRAPACFVEAHIEQGPSLAARGATLGVVTSIAGMAGIEIVFAGRRGHAGTVPMDLRSDALGAAAGFVRRVHDAARSLPGAVATVGRLDVSPGATNTIPGRVELFADLRAPDSDRLDALVAGASSAARHAADGAACQVEVLPRWRYEPVAMDPEPSDALRRAIARAGLEPVELPSGAGHDAAITAGAGVPSGMLFVRSDAEGVSHAPEEATGADAVAAARGRARGGAPGARRMTDWTRIARPSLAGLTPLSPRADPRRAEGAARPRRARAAELE